MPAPVTPTSPTPQQWRHPTSFIVGCFVTLAIGYILVMTDAASQWTSQDLFISIPVVLLLAAALWAIVVRPRLILTEQEVTIVKWFRTIRFALASVGSARSGYDGTVFLLIDSSTRFCGNLQTPHYMRWLRRRSRADRIAAMIVHRAAIVRGERAA